MTAPLLLAVIGANGAGKSTWCRWNRERLPAAFYDADSIAQGLGGFDNPEMQRQARALVDERTAGHLARGESFGFESTYSGNSRPRIVAEAKRRGYCVGAVFVGTSGPEMNIRRVACRVRQRIGHHVPPGEIVRRWNACQTNLLETARKFDSIDVIDNTGRRSFVAARMQGPDMRREAEHLPVWAGKLVAGIARRYGAADP